MDNKLEKLYKYQVLMSWIILEYNVCYFIDSDFAGKYNMHKSWYIHRRINDSLYDQRWELFKHLSFFLGKEIENEVSFDPNRPSAKIVLEKFQSEASNVIEWPKDIEQIFQEIISNKKAS